MWIASVTSADYDGIPEVITFSSKDREVTLRKLNGWLALHRPDAPAYDAPLAEWTRGHHMAAARAIATHTDKEWRAKCIAADHLCHYCKRPTASTGLVKDHHVPVSRGGSDGIDNLVPACWDCNAQKNNTPPDEFIEWAERTDFFNAPRSALVYFGERRVRMSPEVHADYMAIRRGKART
jgi:hypothetical protein